MNNLELIENKIVSLAAWEKLKTQFIGQKIVFTNGCFDILHLGHVHYLAEAKSLGHILVIGLNSDDSVKRLKGKKRPVNPEYARAMVLAALQVVDYVIIFQEETPYELIQQINPHVLVKGGDYLISQVVGADWVVAHGGEVHLIDFIDGFSTSNLIEKLK